MRRSVVFPAPLGPRMIRNSRGFTASERSATATTSAYRFVTDCNRRWSRLSRLSIAAPSDLAQDVTFPEIFDRVVMPLISFVGIIRDIFEVLRLAWKYLCPYRIVFGEFDGNRRDVASVQAPGLDYHSPLDLGPRVEID